MIDWGRWDVYDIMQNCNDFIQRSRLLFFIKLIKTRNNRDVLVMLFW